MYRHFTCSYNYILQKQMGFCNRLLILQPDYKKEQLQYTGSPCPRTVTGFCRCSAFRIGKIRGHNYILRNFQFRKFLPVKSNKEHASIPGNTLLSILYAFYNSFIFLLRTYDLARNRTAGCCLWRSQIDLYLGCSHTA